MLREAAVAGDAEAQYYYAWMAPQLEDFGLEPGETKEEWLLKSAEQGYLPSLLYLAEKGAKKEAGEEAAIAPEKINALLQRAALGGSPRAAAMLGEASAESPRFEQDPVAAYAWLYLASYGYSGDGAPAPDDKRSRGLERAETLELLARTMSLDEIRLAGKRPAAAATHAVRQK